MYEDHHSEEMKQQATGHPLWSDTIPMQPVVTNRWNREERDLEGCVVCDVEGVERIFSWVVGFAGFVRNQPDHQMRIENVRYVGHQDSIYARMVRYMTGESTPEEDASIEYRINNPKAPLSKINNR